MDNLEKVKNILNNQKLDENLYMRIYSFATENISGYIDLFNIKNKSILTVGSSGDQVLNSYLFGAKDVTLIDINPYAKYYTNLKIAAIISLSYDEFENFFFKYMNNKLNNQRYNIDLFKKVSNTLKIIDYEAYYFFLNIFKNYNIEIISEYLMNDDQNNSKVIKTINNYLQNEEKYLILKKILKDISFKFINEDIFKYESNIKYDNIFLSNLCTTVNLFELKDLLIKLKENNLNIDGKMLITYLWNIDYFSNEINFDWKQVYMMPATRSILNDFITEYHNILGILDIMLDKNYKSDLVLIYKNKL